MKYKSGFFIIGTDTDIGKTYTSALFYKCLRNLDTHYFKPIQSGCYLKNNTIIAPDVDFVCKFSDIDYDKDMVYYTLFNEVSPHLAAEKENIELNIDKILNKISILKNKYSHIIFEGAGGLYVPLIRDKFYIYDFIKKLKLKVVIVTSTKVGSINHTMLTIKALENLKIDIIGIVFNKYTSKEYEDDNIKNIISMSGINNYITIKDGEKELSSEILLDFLEEIYA